jgi:hypothetical protein
LNTTPTGENTLRSLPEHSGHTVMGASSKDWRTSNEWPQTVHVYA